MQTFITDKDFKQSARNLDRQRLHSQIYEAIHILSSLLEINDQLVNVKRNVKNHPAAKLWTGYELELLKYIQVHIDEWTFRGYKTDINSRNFQVLWLELDVLTKQYDYDKLMPDWITDDLIKTHRSVLIQKKPEYYNKLWPDCPRDLKMRYDWRDKEND